MLLKGSFEDFFYILIGIVWIAFSIYQGQKKRKQKSASQPTTEKKKSFFESLLDEFTEKNQQFEETHDDVISPALETIEVDENVFEEKKFSYDDYYEERNYEEAEDVLSEKESFAKSISDQQIKPSRRKKGKPQFDLRKAVIYSEILKPRYF
ncbi:MAG: hypothetical protein V2I62_06910 [Bacteroidales bacterium]|jgi:hypothetical protein|nr:hypothetical protein [Bacteroidales bacterium]